MKDFYRFYRPTVFNEQRGQIEPYPQGGVCLYVTPYRELETEKFLMVGYSVCPPSDVFSKDRAKKLAYARRCMWHVIVKNFSTDCIINELIKPTVMPMISMMTSIEPEIEDWEAHERFAEAVQRAKIYQQRAHEQARLHRETVEALNLKNRYHAIQS